MDEGARTDGQVRRQGGSTTMVNGPKDDVLDWGSVDWPGVEDQVRRLRQRIFTASQAGDLKQVRSLQKLMLRSRANALLSVRRVTERNAGRRTAGIDDVVIVTAPGKAALAEQVRNAGSTSVAHAVKRVYIPKADGKQRPLGIPVIFDRAQQAQVVNALEPEWEARFEPKSYGFRPGRGCHDAIEAIFHVARGPNPSRCWILDAALAAAFDRIDHSHLLASLGTFPALELVAKWLKAGVVEQGRFTPTEEGTPQGGVVSPVLLNIALHGMETFLQLIQPGPEGFYAPAVHIEDRPRFAWRGLLLDSARHYQSPAFIEQLIDRMARDKLNVLQWHLTDDQAWRIEIRRYPRLTSSI